MSKHLADFSGRLSSLKLDQWPISIMEIESLNQPLVHKLNHLATLSPWLLSYISIVKSFSAITRVRVTRDSHYLLALATLGGMTYNPIIDS